MIAVVMNSTQSEVSPLRFDILLHELLFMRVALLDDMAQLFDHRDRKAFRLTSSAWM